MRLLRRWWHHRLARELGIALAVKLLLLIALWIAFFDSRPAVDADTLATLLIDAPEPGSRGGMP